MTIFYTYPRPCASIFAWILEAAALAGPQKSAASFVPLPHKTLENATTAILGVLSSLSLLERLHSHKAPPPRGGKITPYATGQIALSSIAVLQYSMARSITGVGVAIPARGPQSPRPGRQKTACGFVRWVCTAILPAVEIPSSWVVPVLRRFTASANFDAAEKQTRSLHPPQKITTVSFGSASSDIIVTAENLTAVCRRKNCRRTPRDRNKPTKKKIPPDTLLK